MRSIGKTITIAAAGMLLVPQLAAATDVETEIQDMKQRMGRMEDQLQAQNDQLAEAEATVDAQQQAIESAALDQERGEKSTLSSFLEKTEFSGWVAASYTINFTSVENSSPGGLNLQNAGAGAVSAGLPVPIWFPHHPNSNTFQLDQAWFSIDKAPTEESRAGFHLDLRAGDGSGAGGFTPSFYSAYASYLIPLVDGLQINGGLLPTLVGAEVEQTNANFNITRGLLWGLQPVTNVGATASLGIGDFSVSAGVLNDVVGGLGIDDTAAPSLTSQVAYTAEKFFVSAAFVYGKDQAAPTSLFALNTPGGATNDSIGIFDVVLTANPGENLSLWVNYDYRWEKDRAFGGLAPAFTTRYHGIAAAGRLAVLDSTGFALRYEYVNYKEESPITFQNSFQSVTATGDWSPVDGLTFKLEYRFDYTSLDAATQTLVSNAGYQGQGQFLKKDQNFVGEYQHVMMLQMMYEF